MHDTMKKQRQKTPSAARSLPCCGLTFPAVKSTVYAVVVRFRSRCWTARCEAEDGPAAIASGAGGRYPSALCGRTRL